MKKLLRFIKGYEIPAVLGPLFKLLEAALELIVPLVIASIIDNGIMQNDTPHVIRMSVWLAVLGIVGLIFSVTAQYFAAYTSCGFAAKMRSALFSHIGTLSYRELDSIGTSTLITRITSDSNQVQTGINLTLRLLLRSPLVVFGAMIMAFTIDVGSAMTFVTVIPALSLVVFGIMLITMPLYKKVQQQLDKILSKTRENLNGARVIRAFCKEEDEIADFREKNAELTRMQKFVGRISSLMNPITYVLINAAVIALIYIGAIKVNVGTLSSGQVVALYNYMAQILVELIKLANLIITLTKAIASGGRIQKIFDTENSLVYGDADFSATDGAEIVFDNVSLKYSGAAEESLEGISFSAKRGQTVGIIGGTGSGKTSLINLIPRFYDATGGSITLSGKNISEYTKESLRENIGVVPQKAVLFSGSIRENMLWGNKNATDGQIMHAIDVAQGSSIVEDKGGLDGHIEQVGRNLSGGQRQRLTIAIALVGEPKILILDDSASALDYATDAKLRHAIRENTKSSIVFIVSQRTSSIMHADKIILLDDGRMVASGTHEELLSTSPLYKEIYDTQFSEEGER